MKINRKIAAILFLSAAGAWVGVAAQHRDTPQRWEQTAAASSSGGADSPLGDSAAGVTVRDMYIYVDVDRPTAVKLFTILGQPVSQGQLPAGTSRFRVSARGIYILKIGSTTRRITI